MSYSRTLRFGMGIITAFALSLGFSQLALTAHAASNTITTNDLLPSNFADATGLGQGDLNNTIGAIIRAALGFLGVIAVVIILFGGFKWMTAGGNEEKVGEAKKLIIAGIIGLAIILSAYAIASFVIGQLVTATTS